MSLYIDMKMMLLLELRRLNAFFRKHLPCVPENSNRCSPYLSSPYEIHGLTCEVVELSIVRTFDEMYDAIIFHNSCRIRMIGAFSTKTQN